MQAWLRVACYEFLNGNNEIDWGSEGIVEGSNSPKVDKSVLS